VINTTLAQYPDVVFFFILAVFLFILALLDFTNVVNSIHSMLHLLIPPLHILSCNKRHESIFLELGYLRSEKVTLFFELAIGLLELDS
jgi:hypothetical protein